MPERERNMESKNAELTRRPAQEEDVDFLRKVHHEAYRDVVEKQFGGWDEKAQDAFFASALKHSPHEVLYYDEQPCGYFSMEEHADFIELHELVLLPEFQGKGIGSKILNDAVELAKTKNLPARLQVLKENKAADLYRRLGFQTVGETETHLEMEYKPDVS